MTKDETKEFIMSHLGLEVEGDGCSTYVSLVWIDPEREPETITSYTIITTPSVVTTATLNESYLDKDMP